MHRSASHHPVREEHARDVVEGPTPFGQEDREGERKISGVRLFLWPQPGPGGAGSKPPPLPRYRI